MNNKNQRNIYQNDISLNAKKAEKILVDNSFKKARDGINTGIVARNFNENILNRTNKADKHLQYQDFRAQPSEEDKFMVSPLSGQKILKEHFGHNNMIPFFLSMHLRTTVQHILEYHRIIFDK